MAYDVLCFIKGNIYLNDSDTSYNKTVNNPSGGTYSHDGLVYTIIRIRDIIGWVPFRQAFSYYNTLTGSSIPTNNLGKLNLILSKLKDFSGYDVFSILTAREKSVYGAHFGGTLQYVAPPTYGFSMYHYYDSGFSFRFSNALSTITGHQMVVQQIMESIFMGLNIGSFNTSYYSNADICKGTITAENLNKPCGDSPDHLSTSALRSKMIADKGNGTTKLSRFLWTGQAHNADPNSVEQSHTVVMTPRDYTDSSGNLISVSRANTTNRFVLMHEASHQLGAPDHYCYDENASKCKNANCTECTQNQPPPTCLMTAQYDIETINSSDQYCSSCFTVITTHLENHHKN